MMHGIYFDGKSSKPHAVTIAFTANAVQFSSTDSNQFPPIRQTWMVSSLEDIDFSGNAKIQLQYGDFPYESLVIEGIEDVQAFRTQYPEIGRKNIYRSVLSGNIYRVIAVSAALIIGVTLLYFFVLGPAIARKVVDLVPIKQEIQLGEEMTEQLFATMDFNTEKSEQLNQFFDELGYQSDYPIELYVEDSDVMNAFAVPGGKIVVYQGIIDKMESWEELAGLLGHELAHVEERHSLKQMSENLSAYIAISALTSDISGLFGILIENSFKLKELSNSRDDETEADEEGLKYMIDNNINPKGMVDLFRRFQGEWEEKAKAVTDVLSTHLATADRIAYLQENAEEYQTQTFPENEAAKLLFYQLKAMELPKEEEPNLIEQIEEYFEEE